MTRTAIQLPLPGFEQAQGEWRSQYSRQMGEERPVRNRSGIEITAALFGAATGTATTISKSSAFRASFPSRVASIRRCTVAAPGRSGS